MHRVAIETPTQEATASRITNGVRGTPTREATTSRIADGVIHFVVSFSLSAKGWPLKPQPQNVSAMVCKNGISNVMDGVGDPKALNELLLRTNRFETTV